MSKEQYRDIVCAKILGGLPSNTKLNSDILYTQADVFKALQEAYGYESEKTKRFEVDKCECGAVSPIEFLQYDQDGNASCLNCIADFIAEHMEQNDELKIEKNTKITWDRTRTVNYNGNELMMNSYSCSTCDGHYTFEQIPHSYCPFCGTKYEHTEDVSA